MMLKRMRRLALVAGYSATPQETQRQLEVTFPVCAPCHATKT